MSTHSTPTPNRPTRFPLRRLAAVAAAVALAGTACNLDAPTGIDVGSAPTLPTVELESTVVTEADPADEAARTTPTVPAPTPEPEPQPEPSPAPRPDPEPAPDPEPVPDPIDPTDPTTTDRPGSIDDQIIEGSTAPDDGTDPDQAGGGPGEVGPVERPTVDGRTTTGGTTGGTSTAGTRFGSIVGGQVEHDAELRFDVPVTLVLEGRGNHVADLFIGIGEVADGSSLVVDWGDGTVENVGRIATGQHQRVSHAFEPTLTFENQVVVATLTEPDGTQHRDRLTFGTRARFTLSYSPLWVKALSSCDTFGKGDFVVTWDNGEGERQASFALGKNESTRVGGFATTFGPFVHGDRVPFELDLVEEDPWGASLFAPWKWDFPIEFHGPSNYGFDPIRRVGDHSYQVNTRSGDGGVDGDDDCAAAMSFDVTVDMLDG